VLEVSIIGRRSSVGIQALGEVRQRLVDVFLWQVFPDGLQDDFQLISRLRFPLKFMVLFQHGVPDLLQIIAFKFWIVWGHSFCSINPGVQFA